MKQFALTAMAACLIFSSLFAQEAKTKRKTVLFGAGFELIAVDTYGADGTITKSTRELNCKNDKVPMEVDYFTLLTGPTDSIKAFADFATQFALASPGGTKALRSGIQYVIPTSAKQNSMVVVLSSYGQFHTFIPSQFLELNKACDKYLAKKK